MNDHMANKAKKVAVPLIGIISQLEVLDFTEVCKEIKNAYPRISTLTRVAVWKGSCSISTTIRSKL